MILSVTVEHLETTLKGKSNLSCHKGCSVTQSALFNTQPQQAYQFITDTLSVFTFHSNKSNEWTFNDKWAVNGTEHILQILIRLKQDERLGCI